MPGQTKVGNGPVDMGIDCRVSTSITVDNIRQRLQRISRLSDEEMEGTEEITCFESRALFLLRGPGKDGDDYIHPVCRVTLQKDVSLIQVL